MTDRSARGLRVEDVGNWSELLFFVAAIKNSNRTWISITEIREERPMTLDLVGASWLAQGAMVICLLAFVASFFVALGTTIVVLGRTQPLFDKAEDQQLGWSERMGRRNSRFNRFYVADEFRTLRRLTMAAWGGAFGSFGLLLLLVAVTANRG
jgi:hypothetical protein